MRKYLIIALSIILAPIFLFAQKNDDLYGKSENYLPKIINSKSKFYVGFSYNNVSDKSFSEIWENGIGGNLTYESSNKNRLRYSIEVGYYNFNGKNLIDLNLFGDNIKIKASNMSQIPILFGVNYNLQNLSIGNKIGIANIGFQNYNERVNKFLIQPNIDFRFGKFLIEINNSILFTNKIMNIVGVGLKFDLVNRNLIVDDF